MCVLIANCENTKGEKRKRDDLMSVRAGLYVRVSTDDQRDNGFSIDNQLRLLEEYCKKHNLAIVDVYNDAGHSGKDLVRPNMQRLIKDIREGKIDKLVAIKVDRLTRNSYDGQWLLKYCEDNDVEIDLTLEPYDVTTANGEMMFSINLMFGQRERKEIGARTKRGLEEMALQKKHPSTTPFGYIRNKETKQLEVDPVASLIVKEIFEMCAKGKSTRVIAHELKNRYFNKFAKTENKVHKILTNPIYTGTFHFGRTNRKKEDIMVIENYCEPLVDEDLHKRAMRTLEKNKHSNYGTHIHLFSSLVKCPDCNKTLSATMAYKYNKDKEVSRKYYLLMCRNKACTSKKYFNTEKLEQKLVRMLNSLAIDMMMNEHCVAVPHSDKDEEIAKVQKAINQLESQEKRLVDLYVNSNLNVESINQKNEVIRNELETQRHKLKELSKETVRTFNFIPVNKFEISKLPLRMSQVWDSLKKSAKKELINKNIHSIEVTRDDDYEVDIKYINFNKEFFNDNTDYMENLINMTDERYKGLEISPLIINEDNYSEIVRDKRVISMNTLEGSNKDNADKIREEYHKYYGIGKEGVSVHQFFMGGQRIDDLILLPS